MNNRVKSAAIFTIGPNLALIGAVLVLVSAFPTLFNHPPGLNSWRLLVAVGLVFLGARMAIHGLKGLNRTP